MKPATPIGLLDDWLTGLLDGRIDPSIHQSINPIFHHPIF
jgi:hypothetical protein